MELALFAWRGLAPVVFVTALISCGPVGPCADAECLTIALADASVGQTIRLEPGTITGNFVVPGGVNLQGAGDGVSIIDSNDFDPVLTIAADASGTVVADLEIQGGPGGGIRATGDRDLTITNLTVSATGNGAVIIGGLASFTADGLTVTGNVEETDFGGITTTVDPETFTLVGLLISEVGAVDLTDVEASGFASYGVMILQSPTTWTNGDVHDGVGTGVWVGGDVEVSLTNVSSHDIAVGATPYGYGVVAANGVNLETDEMVARDNGLAGVLMDHAIGRHLNPTVSGNRYRGMWIQYCEGATPEVVAVEVSGGGAALTNNFGVALGVYQSRGISITDTELSGTKNAPMMSFGSETQLTEIGDGVMIIDSNDLVFHGLVIDSNDRAGFVLDGNPGLVGGPIPAIDAIFDNVQISGAGERGFVLQNATVISEPSVITTSLQTADALGGDVEVANQLTTLPDPIGLAAIIDSND